MQRASPSRDGCGVGSDDVSHSLQPGARYRFWKMNFRQTGGLAMPHTCIARCVTGLAAERGC